MLTSVWLGFWLKIAARRAKPVRCHHARLRRSKACERKASAYRLPITSRQRCRVNTHSHEEMSARKGLQAVIDFVAVAVDAGTPATISMAGPHVGISRSLAQPNPAITQELYPRFLKCPLDRIAR